MGLNIEENHIQLLLSNMVTAMTIRGLLLGDLQVVVVANPILSPLISFVTDVVSQGTSPRIVPIEAEHVLIVDKRDILKEIVHDSRKSRMVEARMTKLDI